jgi:hypothetical protein
MRTPKRLDGFRRHAFAICDFSFGFGDGRRFIRRQRRRGTFGERKHQSGKVVLRLWRQLAYGGNCLFDKFSHKYLSYTCKYSSIPLPVTHHISI